MMTTYHPGGYLPAKPAQNRAAEWDTTAGTHTAWDAKGNVIETRPLTPAEVASFAAAQAFEDQSANRKSVEDKLSAWLDLNRTFLTEDAATQATHTERQIARLTRQVNALIKLALNKLDTDDAYGQDPEVRRLEAPHRRRKVG